MRLGLAGGLSPRFLTSKTENQSLGSLEGCTRENAMRWDTILCLISYPEQSPFRTLTCTRYCCKRLCQEGPKTDDTWGVLDQIDQAL